jgi:uncharacterized OB-fold protein
VSGPGPADAAGPEVDADSAAFWSALREHRVVLQWCGSCGVVRFPPMPACPACGATGWHEVEAAGGGTVYSWVRVYRTADGATDVDGFPYAIAMVDLDEGPRMFGRLEPAAAAAIGLRVELALVDHGGWTELRFRPSEADR